MYIFLYFYIYFSLYLYIDRNIYRNIEIYTYIYIYIYPSIYAYIHPDISSMHTSIHTSTAVWSVTVSGHVFLITHLAMLSATLVNMSRTYTHIKIKFEYLILWCRWFFDVVDSWCLVFGFWKFFVVKVTTCIWNDSFLSSNTHYNRITESLMSLILDVGFLLFNFFLLKKNYTMYLQ